MMGRRAAILAWILAGAVYAAMLGWTLPTLTTFAGGQPVFDMMPSGYTLAQASELVSALGEDGRAFYLGTQHWLDTAYPPLLAIAFILSFRLQFHGKTALVLMAVAAIAAGLDLLENAAVAELLQTEPTKATVAYASRMTIAKSAMTSLAFIALLVGLGTAGWRRASKGFATSSERA